MLSYYISHQDCFLKSISKESWQKIKKSNFSSSDDHNSIENFVVGAGIRTRASRVKHRFLTIHSLKVSSVGRADVSKLTSKANKAATIVNYRKTDITLRSGEVIVFQWYRSCH